MNCLASIFLDFSLPNATTWAYFSLLLAVALFFKFTRLVSMRNWDVLALFLLVPGLLLRQEANSAAPEGELRKTPTAAPDGAPAPAANGHALWYAYLALLAGTGFMFARCLVDLALVRRPAATANMNLAGLAWLGAALFLALIAVAARRPVVGELDAVRWTRGLAIVAHLSVVAALVIIGWRHFQDIHAGMAAATFYLLLPYTATLFDQLPQVLPMALILWAIALYPWPTFSGLVLGLSAGSMYFPALLLPVWLSFYGRRGAGRFAGAFALGALGGMGLMSLLIWLEGPLADDVQALYNVFAWQQWKRPTTEGIWIGAHWAYRTPIFVAYAAFAVGTAFWPKPKTLAHLLALSAALISGCQFWLADRGGLYVLWYLPLLLLLTFRPNLIDREPTAINAETDWLHRLGRRLQALVRRALRVPEPLSPVE